MGNLKKGKAIVQVVVKDEIVKKLDEIAERELTSRSNIAGKIIHENINKYINSEKTIIKNENKSFKEEEPEDNVPLESFQEPDLEVTNEYDLLVNYLDKNAYLYEKELDRIKNGTLQVDIFLKHCCDHGTLSEFQIFKENKG